MKTLQLCFAGKTVILANDDEQKIPTFTSKLIEKHNVDFILSTPSKISLLLLNKTTSACLKNVKIIQLGGEIFPPALYEKLSKLSPNCKIYNGYGPAECSACSCIKEIKNRDKINIGKPFLNTHVYILNKFGNLLPIGYSGEIVISGIGVGQGYVENKALTIKSFIDSPFTDYKMYKTGDLGRVVSNGDIEYIGRQDNQVKLRGLRIELEEITNKILHLPGIKNAITIIKQVKNSEFICSYIVTDNTIKDTFIKNYLKDKLPYYMVPSYIIEIPELPTTINGKIDTSRLPDIPKLSLEHVAPETELEIKVANIIKKNLGIKNISMNQNFFDLGGDSLSAIKVVAEIHNKFNTKIDVKTIFECNDISEICSLISTPNEQNENIEKLETTQFLYPITNAQRGIYYAVNIEGKNSISYNTPCGIFIKGELDIKALENSINEIIKRHSVMRSSFISENGDVYQKINDNINFKLEVQDDTFENVDNIFNEFIKPFDLEFSPLFRISLVRFNLKHYLLLLDFHHIIFDGTSIDIFISELSTLYNNEAVDEVKLDYIDYSLFEKKQKSSKEYTNAKKFWLEKYSTEIPALNMPINSIKENSLSNNGNEILLNINCANDIYDFCKKMHTTPYFFLLSAYYILLYRYTSSEDIIVGTASSGRDNYSFSNTLGMFVRTVPMRMNINPEMKFTEFLKYITNEGLEYLKNDIYPLDELINNLNLPRNINKNPLFDTMFVYQNENMPKINLNNLKCTLYTPKNKISKFNFSLDLTPKEKTITARLEYLTSMFSEDFMKQFLKHYTVLISSILKHYNLQINEFEILTQSEKDSLIKPYKSLPVYYDKNISLTTLFENIVDKNNKKTAIKFEKKSITYEELNEKSNQIANFLIENGIKKNDIVAILLPRSPEMIYLMFGILKAGGAYMLIDKSLPPDRISFMLENTKSKFLFTTTDFEIVNDIKKIDIDTFDFEEFNNTDPKNICSNEDSFAVIYTSGSTGLPKGISLKRQGIINLLYNYKALLNTDTCQNFLSISSVAFDMFIVEIFVALLSGSTVILSNEEEQKIPIYINNLIKSENVNFILTTPSRIDSLLGNSTKFETIKVIQLGGEVFPDNLYEKIKNFAPNCHVFNGYGPSEITACCTSKEVFNSNNISIGKPFFNTQVLICDKYLNICPVGVEGEIVIAGDGVAKGYINNEQLTKKCFVKNPFGSGKLYKTGDIAKYKSNGEIEYIGRKDFQIKIRGLRIELSEIEKQLINIPKIKNAAVIYKKDKSPYILAFYTANRKMKTTEIRNHLAKVLPAYMIPKYIIYLKELPINLNGKIDKKALENYEIEKDKLESYTPPETETEKLFCYIWEKLLDTKVGIDNDVFELGADSLLAIKFKTELLSYNINIDYSDIFKYHTIREFSKSHIDIDSSLKFGNDFSYCKQSVDKNVVTNFISSLKKLKNNKCNNILLLGGNGFVGSHILYDFIQNDTGIAYCIIRDKGKMNAEDRFKNILHYYFGNSLDEYIGNRIIVIRSSILKRSLGLSKEDFEALMNKIDVVINAAAMVKHYGNEDKFRTINVSLTDNLIKSCLKYNKRLLHISSLSVSGNLSLDGDYKDRISYTSSSVTFSEHDFFIGQTLNNEYVKSKFMAEKLVLENISKKNLNAQVLRLGNITNRYSDGLFQINSSENAFFNRVKSFIDLGYIPKNLLRYVCRIYTC